MDIELFTWHTHNDTLSDLQQGLRLAQQSTANSLLVLTCNQNTYPEEALNTLLLSCSLPIFGGIFPAITLQDSLLKQGALIIGFKEKLEVTIFPKLQQHQDEDSLDALITTTLAEKYNFSGYDDFLMFYDALSSNIENFIDSLFNCLDHSITIAGGGAGHLDLIQRPCIFSNQGLLSDAVLLVSLPRKLNTAIAHGWRVFRGPFLISEASAQSVQSLNYQPAFDVYAQAIESASDHRFNDNNFFDIAKHFPLGIADINNNLVVRDPILSQNNHLRCVGNIPINSMVYLLESDTDTLIAATAEAAHKLYSAPTEITSSATMSFNCISRLLYMEDEFEKELNVISEHCPSSALFGVLSIGEIANCQSGAICLLNKSTVIGSW